MHRFVQLLRSNWISTTGAVVTTLSFMLFVTTFVFLAFHGGGHTAYAGLIVFVVLPALFVLGLLAIPVGLRLYRGQLAARLEALEIRPIRLLRVFGVLTAVNLAVAGTAGYEALHYMEGPAFCGTLCHEVMSPTYNAYQDSPHARVACVECHVGDGAEWFLKSKLSGLRQVAAVLLDDVQKPIPTPVHNLRPARDTCEQCHWPDHLTGDRLAVHRHFADDEDVTPESSVLMLRLGSVGGAGRRNGIHAHGASGLAVSYLATEDSREEIPWVRAVDAEGRERIYTTEDFDADEPPVESVRTMDCVDCHNQPSHGFEEPERAIDRALAAGALTRSLPFARKTGLELLRVEWTRDGVTDGMRRAMQERYPTASGFDAGTVERAADALAKIWLRNVYPDMAITWGTYPSMASHRGCMRCHDGEHIDEDGNEISMDCETCHVVLADRERDPDILEQLGLQGDR